MSRLRRPLATDGLIAAGFVVVGLVDVLAKQDVGGPRWVNAAGMVAVAAAIFARRNAPAAAALAYFALMLAFALWLTPPPELVVAVPGLLFVAYAGAAYTRLRAGLAILAGIPLTILAVSLIVDQESVAADVAFLGVLASGSFLVGRALRSRSELAAELHEAAIRAEEEREAETRRAIAAERTRIAREMHDVVAHSISVMVVQAGGARRILEQDPERAAEAAAEVERLGRESLLEMRRLLGVLHPREDGPARAPQPGMDGLEALVERARTAGLPVELTLEGERRPLPAGLDVTAYRIVQEALTNALQHACSAPTEVHVRWTGDALELEVNDCGPGPLLSRNGDDGQGLVGMRERVRLYGGELRTGRRRAGGFEVKARIPLKESP